jgi:hypothetical protein
LTASRQEIARYRGFVCGKEHPRRRRRSWGPWHALTDRVYAIVYPLQTAKKPETRAKRMETILAMMAQGKKFHP